MKNKFYSTKKGKGRGYWLFDITAENYNDALKKSRKAASIYGDVVSYIKKGGKFNVAKNSYSVFGGKK